MKIIVIATSRCSPIAELVSGLSLAKGFPHVVVAALPKLILLRDGRDLKTLADARALILALPERHQANQHWDVLLSC
jgi:hypothetical protein